MTKRCIVLVLSIFIDCVLGAQTFEWGDLSMFNLGDAKAGKDFKLVSGLLSLAYKF
jgi:hypothetical protein